MPKIGRTLSYINTERKGKSTEQSSVSQSLGSSRPGGSVSMPQGDYLLKSIWDKVFEIRTDSQGTEYIFGKLPMVTQYGITMYSGDGVDIPSLASGLPFDGRTIWYNPDTKQIEVIGGTGGGSGEGVSNFWDLSGIPSWITNSKPKYTYSEIEGTPDLGNYALRSDVTLVSEKLNDFLEGSDTDNIINKWKELEVFLNGLSESDNLATILSSKVGKDYVDGNFVTLSTTQSILAEKDFVGGLKVNGSPIYYDTEKKYWKLEGDLLVTGGVTMYGNEGTFTPSTIMDAILYDDATLGINSNGQLYVKGGTSGGGLDITALQNYLTQNSYLNVTEGDGRYLKLSGGSINSGDNPVPLTLSNTASTLRIAFKRNNEQLGYLGFIEANKPLFYDTDGNGRLLLHERNYSSYALPLSGGTIANNSAVPLTINANNDSQVGLFLQSKENNKTYVGWDSSRGTCLYEFASDSSLNILNGIPRFNTNTIWHSGNDGSGSGLDADLLDGVQSSGYGQYVNDLTINLNDAREGFRGGKLYNATNAYDSTDASYRGFLEYGSSGYRAQFNSSSSNNLYYRWCEANTWKPWRKVAFEDSNVSSATYAPNTSKLYSTDNIYSYGSKNPYYGYLTYNQTHNEWDFKVSPNTPEHIHVYSSDKLRTARTIWGQSFDGTGNVSGHLYLGNNKYIYGATSGGSAVSLLSMDNTNNVNICYGSSASGSPTYLHGNFIQLCYGLSHTAALTIGASGKVGIGTTNPTQKLDVIGKVKADALYLTRSNGDVAFTISEEAGTNGYNIIAGGGTSYIRFYTNDTSGAYERMRIDSYGNVGIGTTFPNAKLHVSGDILGNSICVNNTDGSGNGISLYKGTASINFVTTYGIWFGLTSTFGTHGNVNGDWATYFSMSNDSGRGWIFRRSDNVRVASISKDGNMLVNGGITMYSDQRKKTILNHVELSLKQIADAPLIEHYYNSDDKKTTHVGSIAQYWAEMNDWFCKLDSEGFYTMEIQNAALASAISIARELDRYETKTDKTIKQLKKRICQLEEEVERLKSA